MRDNPKSPNVGRQLQAAVRAARLPLAEKALLTQLALSHHPDAGGKGVPGAAPKKDNLMLWAGFLDRATLAPDEPAFSIARDFLKQRGLIAWQHREKATTLYTLNLAAIEQLAAPHVGKAGATQGEAKEGGAA